MHGHRIISMGEAAPPGRHAVARRAGSSTDNAGHVVRGVRGIAGLGRSGIAFLLVTALVAGLAMPGAADAATVAAQPDETPAAADAVPQTPDAATSGPQPAAPSAAPVTPPLGSAAGLLETRPAKGRRHSRAVAPPPMPGCTDMATLDGVSAALQAGAFGRGKGLAIMQFRNVVTESQADDRVACRADVLLSDGSLHSARDDLHRARRGTRLHIEVAGDRADAPTTGDTTAEPGRSAGTPGPASPPDPSGPQVPAT